MKYLPIEYLQRILHKFKNTLHRLQKKGEDGMDSKISYHINFDKAVETILWLANKKPGIDIYHIGKIIFYAEKKHLNKYAMPIIGDEYHNGDFGPFPSTIRDMIQKTWIDMEMLSVVSDAFNVEDTPYATPKPKRKPDLGFFSETDIECLENALKICGPMSFDELKNKAHDELCYLNTPQNKTVDYAALIESDNPLRDEIIEEMEQTHRYAVI